MFTAAQADSYDLWRTSYPPEWDKQEAKFDAIEELKNELLEGECNPLTVENFVDFLTNINLTDEIQRELMDVFMKNIEKMPNLLASLKAYWEDWAYRLAKEEFEHR